MSKKRIIAYGKVSDDGIPGVFNKEFYISKVGNAFKGKRIKWTVEEDTNTVSQDQRGFYNGVILSLLVEHLNESGMNYTKSRLDHYLRMNFLFVEEMDPVTATIEMRPLSLSDEADEVDTKMMSDYWEKIYHWASTELSYKLPDPDPTKKRVKK